MLLNQTNQLYYLIPTCHVWFSKLHINFEDPPVERGSLVYKLSSRVINTGSAVLLWGAVRLQTAATGDGF
jgi:hypothetical protein